MKKMGFGVIGCGSIADVHMKAISEIGHARLVEVCSRREERAREAAQQYGSGWSTDYRQLLSNPEIDIVCVTTGSGSHAAIGLDVLMAGKHLLMEKPIAMTSSEAAALIRIAEKQGLVLSAVSQSRFAEHHRLVKRVIDEGKIGKLLLVEISRPFYRTQDYYDSAAWRGTLAEDGGALMNQGIHSIDLLLWIAGKVNTVIGRVATQTHRIEAEDMGLALLTLENGAYATVMCSTSIVPGLPPGMNFYGEKGSIQIKGPEITHWAVPDVPLPKYSTDGAVGAGAKDPRNISSLHHRHQILDVIEAVSEGRKPFVQGEDGRDAVRLIELIYESSARGGMPIRYV